MLPLKSFCAGRCSPNGSWLTKTIVVAGILPIVSSHPNGDGRLLLGPGNVDGEVLARLVGFTMFTPLLVRDISLGCYSLWSEATRTTKMLEGTTVFYTLHSDWRAMPVACLATIKSGTMLLMRLLPGQHPHSLENFFVTMILFCEVSDEYAFFEKVWKLLADDIQYRLRDTLGNPGYELSKQNLKTICLTSFRRSFQRTGRE